MRIIYDRDTESDYYDCMQKYTEDRETTYNRKFSRTKTYPTLELYKENNQKLGIGIFSPKYSEFSNEIFIIGFCGELILCLEKTKWDTRKNPEYYYGYDNIIEQIVLSHETPRRQAKKHVRKWELKCPPSYYDKVKTAITQTQPKFIDKLFEATPIWKLNMGYYHDEIKVSNDPLLKRYNFQTVYSPPNAYQKLESYLYNVARPLKPIPEISDEIMAEAKGFNKYSFRKDKSK